MSRVVPTYHQRVAHEKRALIVTAETALFLELGYDRTSLARIAERSGVSRATLFKQFPSKAALFDAIVAESWSTADEVDPPPVGNVVDGLGIIGRRYAELLGRAQMTDLFRIVIAELPRFPELAHAQFSQGEMPYFESVRSYLLAEHEAGTVRVEDVELAAQVVDEAVRTIAARYATPGPGPSTND
ncbi:TetR/AcrR family transcriptional regulator [Micromonospora sp. WMMA1923]|uniref:TetR/AcrR family transcriptional regulator n=1 Tax=Micromonospora sp. WMMA1923 TaxID=3404125 RepID=UPI003B92E4C7